MKVFTCKFMGHYPVGACAVVVAQDIEAAITALGEELATEGLKLKDADEWLEIETDRPRVVVLQNGDY